MSYRLFIPLIALVLAVFPLTGDEPINLPATGEHSASAADTVQASGSWNSNFRITWNITEEGSKYHYVYKITDSSGAPLNPSVTHLLLEVSPTVTTENINSMIATERGNVYQGPKFFTPEKDMSGLPNELYGIKFELGLDEEGAAIIDFYSSRPPIWGRFFAQGSEELFAQNAWVSTPFGEASTHALTLWMPVPTVGSANLAVPEPATVLILASVLAFVAIMKRREAF